MLKICLIISLFAFNAISQELPKLEQKGKCLFFINVETYVKESIEVNTINDAVYLKGLESLETHKEDPYFYYKFTIPPECPRKPMLGFQEHGITILLAK